MQGLCHFVFLFCCIFIVCKLIHMLLIKSDLDVILFMLHAQKTEFTGTENALCAASGATTKNLALLSQYHKFKSRDATTITGHVSNLSMGVREGTNKREIMREMNVNNPS